MSKLWLIISLCLLSAAGFAEKPQQEKTKPRLELPDVLVYGEDTEVRHAGEKLIATADSLYLQEITAWSQYESWVKITEVRLPTPAIREKMSTSSTLISALYGNFHSLNLQLKRRQEWKSFSYKIDFSHLQSSGLYKNNQYNIGDTQAGVSFFPSSNFGISFVGGYFRKEYGLYEDHQRTFSKGWLGGNLIIKPTAWSAARVDFEMAEVPLRNEPIAMAFNGLTERYLQIKADYTLSFSALQIGAQAGLLRDYYRIADAYGKPNSVLEATLDANWRARNWLSLAVGLRSEYLFIKIWGEKRRTSPYGKILLLPRNNFALYLRASREYHYLPYQQLWKMNPFLREDIDLSPEDVKGNLEVGVEYQPVSGFLLTGSLLQQEIKNYRYWYDVSSSGLFQRGQIPKIRLTELRFQLQLHPSPVFGADLAVHIYSDKIFPSWPPARPGGGQNSFKTIPYRPQIALPLALQYKLGANCEVRVNAFFMGDRFTDIYRNERLREYLLLSVLIETKLGKGVSLALRGRNLADDRYYTWRGYPEMGTTVTAGMRFKW